MNRPDRRNAMSNRMVREVGDALAHAAEDRSVRVLVLTGAGTSFCPGADLQAVASGAADGAVGAGRLPRPRAAARDARRDDRRHQRGLRRRRARLGLCLRSAPRRPLGAVQHRLPRRGRGRRHGWAVDPAAAARRGQGPRALLPARQARRRRGAADRPGEPGRRRRGVPRRGARARGAAGCARRPRACGR